MTTVQLVALICAALLFQVAVGAGVMVWRRRAAAPQIPQLDKAGGRALSAGAWEGWRDFRVTSRAFEDVARSQCSFYLQPVDGKPLAPFRPGQYITLALRLPVAAGGAAGVERGLIRCYSLSDRPDAAHYRITVKRMSPPLDRPDLPPGAASTHLHERVREGDVLKLKAPSGRFFIDVDASSPAVFLAGGIGITPMMSMLRWCVAAQPGRPVHLVYGVRCGADHAFRQVLNELAASHPAFKLHVVYSCPGLDDVLGRDYQHTGYIDLELLRNKLPHGRHHFYVCGPPAMMQSLVQGLRAWNVKEDDIRFEAFGPAPVRPAGPTTNEPLAAPPTSLEVRLTRSGRTLIWDGQDANLLDFAERHGVPVDSGCRSGNCGTCETKLVSGTVDYAAKPDHDIARGQCLLCVGKPQSALVLEA